MKEDDFYDRVNDYGDGKEDGGRHEGGFDKPCHTEKIGDSMSAETKILTDEQIGELSKNHLTAHAQFIGAGDVHIEGDVTFARALLERYGQPAACPNQDHMGDYACGDKSQCWEPCGELGHSKEHAMPADADDTKRLDWLDNVAHCADWMEGEPTKRVIRACDGAEFTGASWREAIDAARRRIEGES